MICLRCRFVTLTLIILINSFCLVFAQSMYDFKGKKTNVRPYEMDTNSKKQSNISVTRQNIKLNPKIRFRYLYGTYNSDSQEATTSTSSIIWDGFGIGQSVFKYKTSKNGNTYDLENKSIDLSYTFGDEYTLTLGSSSVSSGKLNITTSDSEIYKSSDVFGYGYFSILGIEYGIIELLLGYQYIRFAFIELETESTSTYWSSFKDSGSQYATGIGVVF